MIKLIKAELKKIFHKKSFYIVSFIFILYALMINVVYKSMDSQVIRNESQSIEELEKINEGLDLNDNDALYEYITNITSIEIKKLEAKYPSNNAFYLINEYLFNIVYRLNEIEYVDKENNEKEYLEETKEIYLEKIKNNDYKYFIEEEIKDLKESLSKTNDKDLIKRLEEYIKLSEYRLENDVPFDNDNYLNNAIDNIKADLVEYSNLMKKDNLTKTEERRRDNLHSSYLKNYYILEHQVDIDNSSSLQKVLQNFSGEFELFFIIFIVMICGSIVSEEYNKGTIKYLLTKPYKRSTILTSKLLTALLLIPATIIFMILIELIIGGLVFGFSSLSVPVLIYNATTGTLINYHILSFLFLTLLASFPSYIILGLICFGLSTITASTSAAITITFLFYLASKIIANLALVYNLKLLKLFISLHWDFNYLVSFSSNPYNIKTTTSLIIILIYISVILCTTYIYFSKKDVKNI